MRLPRLSLVICTVGRPEAVGRLLDALARQTRVPDEIVVVDASDDDRTEHVVAGCDSGLPVRHVAVDANGRGLTRQRNRGIDESSGDLVAFLDDDTVPEPAYFAELTDCFARHPGAIGVGGAIVEGAWQPARTPVAPTGTYRWDGWERPEASRWRLRRRMGLDAGKPPGVMPASGHGRPVSYLPPSGADYVVEFVMGGASAWRRSLFDRHRFSAHFEGYGLYEDLDFCISVREEGSLYLCTAARLEHRHVPDARPRPFHYGRMVSENGWYVWRRRWPDPASGDRARWWATSLVLAGARIAGGRPTRGALAEAAGRVVGLAAVAPTEWSSRYRRRFGATPEPDPDRVDLTGDPA